MTNFGIDCAPVAVILQTDLAEQSSVRRQRCGLLPSSTPRTLVGLECPSAGWITLCPDELSAPPSQGGSHVAVRQGEGG